MARLLSLTKVSLKTVLSFRDGKVKNTKLRKFLPLLLFIIMIPSLGSYVFLIRELVLALLPIQQEGLVIGLLFSASGAMIFFFGIFLVPSVFYFSKDIETLLSLPLKPYEILTSKLLVAIVYEYITEAILFTVVLAAYLPLVQPSLMFYVYLILIFIFLPIVPLILDALIIMLIMMFLPFAKNKDFFNYLSGFLALAFAIGINVLIQGQMVQMSEVEIINMLQSGNNSLMNLYAVAIPSIPYAVKALVNLSFIDFIIYVGITLAFMAGFMILAQAIYFKGVIGVGETGANRKSLSEKAYTKSTSVGHPRLTYALKELKLLVRTPVYFMNNISTIIIMPVILGVAIIPNALSDGNTTLSQLSAMLPWHTGEMAVYALSLGLAAGYFMSGLNLITTTAISREGSNVWFMKAIPMSYFDQALAKIYPGLWVSAIGGLLLVLPVALLLQADIMSYVHAFIGLVLSIIAMNFWGLLVDIYHPKLVWETETAAVKQNMNAVFTMLPGFALAGGLVGLIIYLSNWNSLMVYALVFSIALALTVISVYALNHYCEKGLSKIDA